ncbi:GlcG/HbpS family heme-binding protein [Burkholderia cenocepacia]|uniref:GlcG/HbpS family heme-binding protein n=1 Tax=Burkholderia cenocepacia TaxID=95486 RepID=UPI0028612BFC|nr:heme-binding protein [Burkholderia cenocepacia]MDR5644421.1 heme-binding protein [Burkholderia cenocepacia]
MKTKAVLGQKQLQAITDAATAEAQLNGWLMTIAVVDDGGHPLALIRMDGAAPISAYIATEKARTAAMGRRESQQYEDMINGGRVAFLSAPLGASLGGGIPIIVDGQVVGAVSASGARPDQDAQVATAGVQAVQQ